MGNYKFILSGGGTGGHIYPAIAIANELGRRYPKAEFLFVGAKGRMEMQKVPQAGYKIVGLWISGIDRKFRGRNLWFPLKLIKSIMKARSILKEFKPTAVIGTGGFASGPILYVASRKGIPTLIQEQNSYAGLTNKILAKKVDRICVAYEGMDQFFPTEKIVITGNPVRRNVIEGVSDKKEAYLHFDLNPSKNTLLILGGSLGAARINNLIETELDFFSENNIQLLWQTGSNYFLTYEKYDSPAVRVVEFIHRMDYAYAIADTVISRSGAGSVSELALTGKPVIFIPSPHVAEDHQTANARSMAAKNAALMIRESELESDFRKICKKLLTDSSLRHSLGANIRSLARPNATERIVDEIEILLKKTED